jgi:hypothetical protein
MTNNQIYNKILSIKKQKLHYITTNTARLTRKHIMFNNENKFFTNIIIDNPKHFKILEKYLINLGYKYNWADEKLCMRFFVDNTNIPDKISLYHDYVDNKLYPDMRASYGYNSYVAKGYELSSTFFLRKIKLTN